ncbi:MAG: EAL domain-containing protein [Cohaesibacter sp.]|jgi:diguanylate cyclase (GGDEF)-like protein|nr:EAL domain-containing protein [Cohaesibacter sp.]
MEQRLERRVKRERAARKQAEALLEDKSRMLFEANVRLEKLNSELENRVSERTRDLELARRQAIALSEKDQLTGLANRRSFLQQLEKMLLTTQEHGLNAAILALDLDHFKNINDTLGHHAGDALLIAIAQRLKNLIRDCDSVARLGGDEFAIICPITEDGFSVERLADRVVQTLERPVFFEGKSLEVSCSIGIAMAPTDGNCPTDLQRYADIALYCTKERGRGAWTFFEPSMGEWVEERKRLASNLRVGLDRDEIEVWYQPIVDLKSGKTVGVETLSRWFQPDFGLVGPETFIPIAEETALIYDLGDIVLNKACRDMKPWLDNGISRFSVNLSPKQLKDRHLVARVAEALARHQVPANKLCLEVTESMFLWDQEAAKQRLEELSDLGVRIALDDFGTGFSNLSQLRFLPIDYLKIDRSFVCDIDHDQRALALVKAVFAISNGMSIRSIAEGVETAEQAEILSLIGGDLAQGYHYAKPMPFNEFEAFLKGNLLRAS